MKIKITSRRKNFTLRFPLWLVNLIPFRLILLKARFKAGRDEWVHIKNLDMRMLKSSIRMLSKYKGLDLIKLKSHSGVEVSVTV